MNGTLCFLWHRKGGYLADGPFVYVSQAIEARNAYPFGDEFDIVEVDLPLKLSDFN
jgi:hypothetical protein